ncbi:LysM peptidoglycan-binding domain-containing protein [Clostridium ganghwense]|uniref:LysM peptidoglycan-binding domain-containing protein n=1 Tax=Clostridium ganghwense TaxID=312089 RepID=A0ABT4CQP2_9CLOT|nr:LysM peptidoglycan-binding domain-containing protein [Clostridium ganghwense]MCY6371375.1 LysM peptidoglycan-binding domain-containing protein [Clostridium ganghwense]
MNSKLKKSLIIISSGIVLFLGVFFMTRSISNLIDKPSDENVITMNEKSLKPDSNKNTKDNSSTNKQEKSNTTNVEKDDSQNTSNSNETAENNTEYVVRAGDTLSTIAHKLMPWSSENTAIKTLIEMNNIKNSEILPVGVHLLIPKNPIDTANCVKHTVLKGETLYHIASKYFPSMDANKAADIIMKKNNISDAKLLTENRVIYIPEDEVKSTNAKVTAPQN